MRTLIQYRTTDIKNQFVVIPDLYVSSMLRWLSDNECAEIIRTEPTDNCYRLPATWPNYETCKNYIATRSLILEV